MPTVDLVFRSIGERTAELALELATESIRPDRVFVVGDVRPLCEAVDIMRRLPHQAEYVVYVDADCLILEPLRPFLERTRRAYVDCYVSDPFRGRIHCGVHITRIDLVREMARLEMPVDDEAFVLRPESRLRNAALERLGEAKEFRNFHILHDHFQFYRDIYAKYALRELRSRKSPERLESLALAMTRWHDTDGTRDFAVARMAVLDARALVPADASARQIADSVAALPTKAAAALEAAGIEEKGRLDRAEVLAHRARHPKEERMLQQRPKIFGIGLSRTGTRSLTAALHAIGFDTIHYPADSGTLEALTSGRFDFPILAEYDGITDITVAPYFAQLDRRYPGSKFILTVRDKEPWLRSARYHWTGRSAFDPSDDPERRTYMEVRRLLRAATYGCYEFDEERFSWVYDQHVRNVRSYFAGRAADLLELDVCAGDGWEPLCEFLGREVPNQPFPHKGQGLTRRIEGGEVVLPAVGIPRVAA